VRQEQLQLLQAARGQAAKYSWPPALLARVEAAIGGADPWGPDSLASGAEWWGAIRDALLDLQDQLEPDDQARLAKLLAVASAGAGGARPPDVADLYADYIGGVFSDVATIASRAADVPAEAAKVATSPVGWATLLVVLGAGALWLRGR
jgi:hypothetical protein